MEGETNTGMNVELTIAIPTFNRARWLEESLNMLLPQCEGRPVEVCVSNNASTDSTTALLAGHPRIRVCTQPSNIGIDRNILAAIRMASGKYVLPIGDDEAILPGGIERILDELRASPDMLVLNAPADRLVTNRREAFELYWDRMPLGGFAIRTEYAAPRLADRYLGTWHAYAGAAWDYLLECPQARVRAIAGRIVDFRKAPKSYAAQADIVYLRAIPRWFRLLPKEYGPAVTAAKHKYWRRCATPRALAGFASVWLRRHV
jgi:glycosyltransferase involved in cell wall biosynthesis